MMIISMVVEGSERVSETPSIAICGSRERDEIYESLWDFYRILLDL